MSSSWIYRGALSLLIILAWFVAPVHGQQSQSTTDDLPTRTEQVRFDERGNMPMRLSGEVSRMQIDFGGRLDQLTTSGELTLNFRYSPTLVEDMSQLRISLNGETIGTIALRGDNADQRLRRTISIEPRLFSLYNQLQFDLIAEARGGQCRANSASAWLEISGSSQLTMTQQQLRQANDLAFFPEPFFDRNDFSPVNLSWLIPSEFSSDDASAMAIITSYFGALANWRGTSPQVVPLAEERLPERHLMMTLTNQQLERHGDLFPSLTAVTTPQLRVIDNPQYPVFKVLVLQAPDSQQLRAAAQTLVANPMGMSGPDVTLTPVDVPTRQAYMAPRWISTKQPVTLAELVDQPSQLQRRGYQSGSISVPLRLPPDLFTWQQRGIPLDLKYRYTGSAQPDESRLQVSINGDFVRSYNLVGTGTEQTSERLRVPLIGGDLLGGDNLQLPAFKLAALNQLQFDFSFNQPGGCETVALGNTVGAIDGDSQIDLRGYQHYTAMPDLYLFGKTGFPFSRHDDLSQTRVIMDEAPSLDALLTLLSSSAMIAAATGHPTTHLQVITLRQLSNNEDADLLLIGANTLDDWQQRFGVGAINQQLAGRNFAGQAELLFTPQAALQNSGASAAMVSFASPLAKGRTVVAMTATSESYLGRIASALQSSADTDQFAGFLTVLTPARITALDGATSYYVGELTWHSRLTFHLSRYPIVIAVIATIALITLAIILYWTLSRFAARRQRRPQ